MHLDFPTILFFLTLVTGFIWAVDAFFFSRSRLERAKDEADADEREKISKEPWIVEMARSFFPIILIVLLLRSFLVEPFRIPSNSMMPTLLTGDFILVNKYKYGIRLPVINKKVIELGAPQSGDVVVFRYPKDPSTDYIKRVIGVGGDRIEYRDKMLYINGKGLTYSHVGNYVGAGSGIGMSGARVRTEAIGDSSHDVLIEPRRYEYPYTCMQNNTFTVPEGHYFVMGDNRDNSNDSRFWCSVPDENLVGKAFMVWMNWDSAMDGLGVTWGRIGNTIN